MRAYFFLKKAAIQVAEGGKNFRRWYFSKRKTRLNGKIGILKFKFLFP
jgi:hypothetical protein